VGYPLTVSDAKNAQHGSLHPYHPHQGVSHGAMATLRDVHPGKTRWGRPQAVGLSRAA